MATATTKAQPAERKPEKGTLAHHEPEPSLRINTYLPYAPFSCKGIYVEIFFSIAKLVILTSSVVYFALPWQLRPGIEQPGWPLDRT
jgi:hypothetical protein